MLLMLMNHLSGTHLDGSLAALAHAAALQLSSSPATQQKTSLAALKRAALQQQTGCATGQQRQAPAAGH
jgi:hypothetical protein